MTACVVMLLVSAAAAAALTDQQRGRIDQITGAKGVYTLQENVHKVSFPRADVRVLVEGRPLHPFLGLTSWAAFTSGPHVEAMVMGDLVLFEDEVNPVMSVALEGGLAVTALHNHFFFDQPRVMFMHIGGRGSIESLASVLRQTQDRVKQIRASAPQPATRFTGTAVGENNSIDPVVIETILGVKGQGSDGMYKLAIGRNATAHGAAIGNQMGLNTWAAFAGSNDSAVVDGDFAMLEEELQGVLKALRKANINIVAIHNHMTHEEPQYVFLHYWGKGRIEDLAKGLLSALSTQRRNASSSAQGINFDSFRPGPLPAGFAVTMTHEGGAPKWEIVTDSSAPSKPNVLAQTSQDKTSGRFPLAIYEKAELADGEVSVKFKPVSGTVDQAAGIVWRYRDQNNYYIVRANALENNVVLYKVERGKRTSLAPKGTASGTYGVKETVPKQTWSGIGVKAQGKLFTVFFNEQRLFEVEDGTFGGAGKTGLWTKADSVTHFDDFRVAPAK